MELDPSLEIHPVRSHIGFKLGNKNVINVNPRKSGLRIELLRTRPKDVKDPEKRVRYLENSFKYWNQHVSTITVYNLDDIDYALFLIRQVYKRFIE